MLGLNPRSASRNLRGTRSRPEAPPGSGDARDSAQRPGLRSGVLDEPPAPGEPDPRDLLPRLLQAAASRVLHRAADAGRRRRLRPVQRARHDRDRGGAARPQRHRQRRQPAVGDPHLAAAGAAQRHRHRRAAAIAALRRAAAERPRSLDVLSSRYRVRDPGPARVSLPPLAQREGGQRGPLDPDGRDQPADRPLAGLLLGLHAAAQPGRLAGGPGAHQRAAAGRSRSTATSAR